MSMQNFYAQGEVVHLNLYFNFLLWGYLARVLNLVFLV